MFFFFYFAYFFLMRRNIYIAKNKNIQLRKAIQKNIILKFIKIKFIFLTNMQNFFSDNDSIMELDIELNG